MLIAYLVCIFFCKFYIKKNIWKFFFICITIIRKYYISKAIQQYINPNTYKFTKLYMALVYTSADRSNTFVETGREYKPHCAVRLHMLPFYASPT